MTDQAERPATAGIVAFSAPACNQYRKLEFLTGFVLAQATIEHTHMCGKHMAGEAIRAWKIIEEEMGNA